MLNYETLLSSYDDKLTLMQWLRKVEKALAGASASSFEVVKTGNATIRFKINFEDGTYLESDDIVLQQGESVASGEIRNGHLYLTLTNGQELDCGELFNGEVPSLEVRSLEVTGGLLVGDDANVAMGGDLVVHGLTEVQNLLAYGHIETETLTAAGNEIKAEKPIIEDMASYSLRHKSTNIQNEYLGVVKNGNKVTFALSFDLNLSEQPGYNIMPVASFYIPTAVANKLVANNWASLNSVVNAGTVFALTVPQNNGVSVNYYVQKSHDGNYYIQFNLVTANLSLNTTYKIRIEQTYLLSENLAA